MSTLRVGRPSRLVLMPALVIATTALLLWTSNRSTPYQVALPSTRTVRQRQGCPCRRWPAAAGGPAPTPTTSSCGGSADLRGPRQNVVSYSFFGSMTSPYFRGIEQNVRLVPSVYPGWVVRVYTDLDREDPEVKKAICDIECRYDYVDFCDVHRLPGLGDLSEKLGSIWRFSVLGDDSVERFIVRDVDSLLGQRERAAVDEWIDSNLTFHLMRDHPLHGAEILGGMWGGWNRNNSHHQDIRREMISQSLGHNKQQDQTVLRRVLWPQLLRSRDVLSHDSYLCRRYPMGSPFPTQRLNVTDFVGAAVLRSNRTVTGHCPPSCRPAQHQDWLWC